MPETKIKNQKSKIKKEPVSVKRAVKAAPKIQAEPKKEAVVKKTAGVKAEVLDLKGKVIETITVPGEMFGAKINNELISQAIRVYLANKRRGTHSTLTRGEVEGSTAKIYRQKGTGRARHGSKRAPIFVHGGVVFGPKPRDYSMKLPTKMRRAALFATLSKKQAEGEIKIVAGLEKIEAKTKKMADVIKNLKLDGKNRKVLLVAPDSVNAFDNVFKAGRNLEGVNVVSAKLLNAYDVLNCKVLLVMKPAIESMESTFLKK